jgi:hypothetical protein
MDMNLYLAELRLAELREQAARRRRVQAARSARPALRVTLGQALIGLGHQLLARVTVSQAPTQSIGAQRDRC